MSIIIDTREPQELRFALSTALEAARVSSFQEALVAGDYQLAPRSNLIVLVERKAQADLSASIIDGRLFDQMSKLLRRQAELPGTTRLFLLVEGAPFPRRAKAQGDILQSERRAGVHPNSIRGALLSAQQRGIFVLYSKGASDTIQTILWLYRRFHREE